eukprot:1160935-Pelagomonas_calceolata.AAC.7
MQSAFRFAAAGVFGAPKHKATGVKYIPLSRSDKHPKHRCSSRTISSWQCSACQERYVYRGKGPQLPLITSILFAGRCSFSRSSEELRARPSLGTPYSGNCRSQLLHLLRWHPASPSSWHWCFADADFVLFECHDIVQALALCWPIILALVVAGADITTLTLIVSFECHGIMQMLALRQPIHMVVTSATPSQPQLQQQQQWHLPGCDPSSLAQEGQRSQPGHPDPPSNPDLSDAEQGVVQLSCMQRVVVGLGLGEWRTVLLRRRPVVVSVQLSSGPGELRVLCVMVGLGFGEWRTVVLHRWPVVVNVQLGSRPVELRVLCVW